MNTSNPRKIYGVFEFTSQVKSLLESNFQDVLVEGEISNLTASSAGHLYFALKDPQAQIKCLCFRSKARLLRFQLENGNQVIVGGNLGVYQLRGEYCLYAKSIKPLGAGSLQQAFEQLKSRLVAEGLFDTERKKSLPLFPRTIGIVTSPSGAAIHDILRTLRRRHENTRVLLFPAKVQGEGASKEIAAGINALNNMSDVDVIIIGRGGGSIEDLWAFNEERVARAIFSSNVPLVSAVGHEVDFTISDFVADVRAPTPTSAVELVVSKKEDLLTQLDHFENRLRRVLQLLFSKRRNRVFELSANRVFTSAQSRIRSQQQWLDELGFRLQMSSTKALGTRQNHWNLTVDHLLRCDLQRIVNLKREALKFWGKRATTRIHFVLQKAKGSLSAHTSAMRTLSPQAVLNRGYAICRDSDGGILRAAQRLQIGDPFSVTLSQGRIHGRTECIETTHTVKENQ